MKTDYLGLKLKNPIIVSAGPWNKDGNSIKRALQTGVGAVVTESIVTEAKSDVRPRIAYDGRGAQNIRLYSEIQIEEWENEMEIAKSNGGIVIASISGHTPSELAYLAVKMEKFGADAIEISISSPLGESFEVLTSDSSKVYAITKEVVDNVKIPVCVKLSQNVTNMVMAAKAVKKAGGRSVTAINTIRCILGVDIDNQKPVLPSYGGYSGGPIRPIGLASVATIAQAVDLEVCGVGGVENYEHALEYIMLGASAVQIGTAVMVDGVGVLDRIIHDLERWGEDNNVFDVSQIRGTALSKLKALDEIKVEPLISKVMAGDCDAHCDRCKRGCAYGAIRIENGVVQVNEQLCTGCGLCLSVCPEKKFILTWDV